MENDAASLKLVNILLQSLSFKNLFSKPNFTSLETPTSEYKLNLTQAWETALSLEIVSIANPKINHNNYLV